ncbi:MAG TPA: protein translocase subunit SecD, partial [Bdellovibrionales bacterium]|nr:protein translocase subunit SecD [Bdellovibrionales bacterium]
MGNTLNLRIFTILFVFAFCVIVLIPNFINPEGKWWLPDTRLKYGLDIKGGLHLVMGVDTEAVLLESQNRTGHSMQDFLKTKNVAVEKVAADRERITLTLAKKEDTASARTVIEENYANYQIDNAADGTITVRPLENYIEDMKRGTVENSIETLRNRIDEFGVAEPSITAQGTDRILIQLPGVEDPTRAKELINRTARL